MCFIKHPHSPAEVSSCESFIWKHSHCDEHVCLHLKRFNFSRPLPNSSLISLISDGLCFKDLHEKISFLRNCFNPLTADETCKPDNLLVMKNNKILHAFHPQCLFFSYTTWQQTSCVSIPVIPVYSSNTWEVCCNKHSHSSIWKTLLSRVRTLDLCPLNTWWMMDGWMWYRFPSPLNITKKTHCIHIFIFSGKPSQKSGRFYKRTAFKMSCSTRQEHISKVSDYYYLLIWVFKVLHVIAI